MYECLIPKLGSYLIVGKHPDPAYDPVSDFTGPTYLGLIHLDILRIHSNFLISLTTHGIRNIYATLVRNKS